MDILEYFSGQGSIFMGPRLGNGMPGTLRWVGDALMEFGFTPNETKFQENYTGQRGDALVLPGKTEANLSVTFLQFHDKNFEVVTRGETVEQDVDAVTDRVIGVAPLAVGDILSLNAFNVSAVTIQDSTAGTPKTLAADTNYRLDPKAGQIEILDVTTGGPFTGNIVADLTPGAANIIKMMSGAAKEYWVRFVGTNTVPGAVWKNVVADFYRWSPPPSETMSLMHDGQSRLEAPLAGSLLADSTKTANGEFGYFGRMVMLQA
ncbi:hypothetical protein dqs_0629 [Azoarcus olearius]|uniref:phage tail tube protein n=1 Tax=Azoarcus sp. (strain BH72) TaxID=418699 RepID=UPI0008060F0F|nr:hypothetical protein [Azoarcus olearius]ANQ83705.1 hypothetical protein dqs_0629 [Azoarcus olearius]